MRVAPSRGRTLGTTLTDIAGVHEAIAAKGDTFPEGLPWVGVSLDGARLELGEGAVHVWRADLDAIGGRFGGLLERGELERAERIVREPTRRRWMAARGALRALLGVHLDEHPTALRFTRGKGGKPVLELHEDFHFSVSHSGGLAVYALSELSPVGVDVELLERPSGSCRAPDFLRAWVRAEAEGKRTGVGVRNVRAPAGRGHSSPWASELELGGGAVGAIALGAAPVDFQVYAIDF